MIESWHGTYAGYCNRGCRCELCREANTAYMAAYRERKTGKPTIRRGSVEELTFEQRYTVNTANGCWEWHNPNPRGYGAYKKMGAHRWSYLNSGGVIPEGLHLDHTCHTNDLSCAGGDTCRHRSCVNPEHLEPVTLEENIRRGRGHSRRDGYCRNGHAMTPDNLRPRRNRPEEEMECVQCNRERSRRYRQNLRTRHAEAA